MSNRYNLNRLAHFVATVEEGSITAAAIRLGVSKSVVSKQLQCLEDEVGVGLLFRNTRHSQPTDAGLAFFEKAKTALLHATDAFETVMERDPVPKGLLRITAPVDYGLLHVAPLIARFRERYPSVVTDLVLSDERVDPVQARFDLAFRVGWLADSSNLARKLRDFDEIAVCTPETLKQFPVDQPDDIAAMPFIQNQAFAGHASWTFNRGPLARTVEVNIVSTMNMTLAIRMVILNSAAFTILPDFMLKDDLASGRLVRLLPEWSLRKGGVYTVTPPGRLRARALRAFLAMAHQEE